MAELRHRVLVAHGWLAGPRQLHGLMQYLRTAGFDAAAISYPSLVAPFSAAVDIARAAVAPGGRSPLHLIGYSLGGLVMRALAGETPPGLASLLLIGAPIAGSPLANLARRIAPTPALRRLSTDAPAFSPLSPDIRIGCIAGSRSGLIGRLIGEPSDGRVPVSSALAAPYHDARVVPLDHDALIVSHETARLAVGFLRDGRF